MNLDRPGTNFKESKSLSNQFERFFDKKGHDLTEPFFSERIKKHDQINGNLFLGFSAWKWLDWKVGINDLPLFLQSNPTAFYFLLFRPYKAGFSVFVTNICFFLLNFVLQTDSFTCFDHISSCYTSSAFVNVAISSKKVWKI